MPAQARPARTTALQDLLARDLGAQEAPAPEEEDACAVDEPWVGACSGCKIHTLTGKWAHSWPTLQSGIKQIVFLNFFTLP